MNNGPKSLHVVYRSRGAGSVVPPLGDSTGTILGNIGDRVEDLSSKFLTFRVVLLSLSFLSALPDTPLASVDDCRFLLLEEELFVGSGLAALVVLFSPAWRSSCSRRWRSLRP